MSNAPETSPSRGMARDFRQASAGAKASAAELRQYVQQFRGKSPQEMLGLVAGSNLVQSTILATVLTVVFLAVFTVGPYLWTKMSPPVAQAEPLKPAAAPVQPAPPTAVPPAAVAVQNPANTAVVPPTGAPPTTPPTAKQPSDVPRDPVLDRLGVGETKTAEPGKNPLESGLDDLLKDLK